MGSSDTDEDLEEYRAIFRDPKNSLQVEVDNDDSDNDDSDNDDSDSDSNSNSDGNGDSDSDSNSVLREKLVRLQADLKRRLEKQERRKRVEKFVNTIKSLLALIRESNAKEPDQVQLQNIVSATSVEQRSRIECLEQAVVEAQQSARKAEQSRNANNSRLESENESLHQRVAKIKSNLIVERACFVYQRSSLEDQIRELQAQLSTKEAAWSLEKANFEQRIQTITSTVDDNINCRHKRSRTSL